MNSEITKLSQLNVERQQLIVRFDNLTEAYANLEGAKSSVDSRVIGLSAELDSIKKRMAEMMQLLGSKEAEISLLQQNKGDQVSEIY